MGLGGIVFLTRFNLALPAWAPGLIFLYLCSIQAFFFFFNRTVIKYLLVWYQIEVCMSFKPKPKALARPRDHLTRPDRTDSYILSPIPTWTRSPFQTENNFLQYAGTISKRIHVNKQFHQDIAALSAVSTPEERRKSAYLPIMKLCSVNRCNGHIKSSKIKNSNFNSVDSNPRDPARLPCCVLHAVYWAHVQNGFV